MSTWNGGRLVELDETECWELLASRVVGRIGYDDGSGPVVVPLNYQVLDGCIRVRTTPHSALGLHARDRRVAFEIDDVDNFHSSGWSVLVRGRASLVDLDVDVHADGPETWAAGNRPLLIEIDPEEVTGRRLLGT
jgi:nitroimidazol reductase NimA-like FMN-containing flavoprotein (pyridoxamine 5'-phosphate oxidase superfamily)